MPCGWTTAAGMTLVVLVAPVSAGRPPSYWLSASDRLTRNRLPSGAATMTLWPPRAVWVATYPLSKTGPLYLGALGERFWGRPAAKALPILGCVSRYWLTTNGACAR